MTLNRRSPIRTVKVGSNAQRLLGILTNSAPSCGAIHADNLPGIYDDAKRGPCCAHCQGDLGVRGPFSDEAGRDD